MTGHNHLSKGLAQVQPQLTPSLWSKNTPENLRKLKAASEAVAIISTRVLDFDKTPSSLVNSVTETISVLLDAEIASLIDLRTGIATRSKFFPAPADIHEFLRSERTAASKFDMPKVGYHKPEPDRSPRLTQDDIAKRRAHVLKALGYNPADPHAKRPRPDFNGLGADKFRDSSCLKSPDRPVSPALRRLLAEQRAVI